ncbi:MAG: Smr/MutS family protein, partial [Deltaproteobacteria bacterium]|nr:Smr/MutS family protein [Deltaproteobacteria bacterium]
VSVSVNTESSGQPSYGLSYGAPGFSGGLVMARRLGLPSELIDRAESLLDDGHRRAMDLLKKLDEERGALASEREAMTQARTELERLRRDEAARAARLFEEHNKKAAELEASIKSALARNRLDQEALKSEVRRAINQGQKPDPVATALAFAKMEKSLNEVRPEFKQVRPDEPLSEAFVGSTVYLPSLGSQGQVTSVNKERNEYRVKVGPMTVKVGLADLCRPKKENQKEHKKEGTIIGSYHLSSEVPNLSINLIGHTVDEAETALEKEIDRAILNGQSKLTIIHGLGTGRLRLGVINYLKKHPNVLAYSTPTGQNGGAGVTEVDLIPN